MKPNSTYFSNKILVLFLLFLDIAGFSLIFPLIPEIINYYLAYALQMEVEQSGLHFWLLATVEFFAQFLPESYRTTDTTIILIGGILASSYSLAQFIVSPYWGKLSDRFGRKPILLITSFGFALSYLLWFFSSSFVVFCLARLLGGLMGGNIGVAAAAMADMSTTEKRVRAMGLVGAVMGIGFLFGPLIGGLALKLSPILVGWGSNPFNGPILVAFTLASISFCANALKLQETLPKIQTNLSSPSKKAIENWTANPFSSLKSIASPLFSRIILIHFIYTCIFAAYQFSFSFYYNFEFAMDGTQIGFVFFYVGCWFVLGQGLLVRPLSRRLPPHILLRLGLMVIPLPLIVFGFAAPSLTLSLITIVPISLGASLVLVSLSSLASLSVGADRQGHALGLLRSFGSLGRACAPVSGAPIYWIFGPEIAYSLASVCLLLLSFYTFCVPLTCDVSKKE